MDIDYGRIPPQALELEEAVLGAVMLESKAINEIINYFKPDIFYKNSNQKVAESILSLYSQSKKIDILTVTEESLKLKTLDELGGALYITQLTSKIASSGHVLEHIRIVYEKYVKREYIRITSEISNNCYDDSIELDDIKDYVESELSKINEIFDLSDTQHIYEIGIKRLNDYWELAKSESNLLGVPSGYTKLDRLTHGWQEPNLIIIGARPSIGKTFVSLHFALNAAKLNCPTVFFSLEMSKNELFDRIISIDTKTNPSKIKSGDLTESKLKIIESGISKLNNCPLYIDDNASLHVIELKAKCRRLVSKYGIKLIIIDYLQLMKGSRERNGNREQEISSISRGLKLLAKELKIPIIALSQLNRDAENKKPMLSNLRESGALEQDADNVFFIHREIDFNTNLKSLLIEFIIAKQRNGITGSIDLYLGDQTMIELSDTKFNEINNSEF